MFRNSATTVDRIRVEESTAQFVMDEETFRKFYERTARGVWLYLTRVTGDRQLADDLLQEAYYRFLRANAAHESESHRRNSLYRIATNLARDARRKSLTQASTLRVEQDVEGLAARGSPHATERSADLTRAMAQLKPKERAMLWLAYGEGASHDEVAAAIGVSAGSLKTMLFRARRKLSGLMHGAPKKGEQA